MFAHIDCNNFYVSCERVFNPSLNGKPVIVLSNNDGCAISRSNEAKALGIPMGAPAFKYKEIIEENNVHVFSANFPLYGDMSNRVMSILATFCPMQEIYSIDECFLDLSGFDVDLKEYGLQMKERVYKWTGLPISIGIAPTKSLCKVATRVAKKFPKETNSVHVIDSEELRIKALKWLEIGEVWGIGRQYTKKLLAKNIKNAYQFTCMGDDWVKKHMSIVGLRLKHDLQGIPSIMIEEVKDKKNIATTRTFDYNTENYEDVKERIVTFTTKCAEKLRKQGSCCNSIQVFIATNFYRKDLPQYSNSICIKLPFATNSTFELAEYAVVGLEQIFKKGYAYKRAGVFVMDFTPENNQQLNLFQNRNAKHIPIMKAMDKLNRKYGCDLLRLGAQAPGKTWRMKQEKLSPHYTTNINEVLTIKV
ncbi:MAG: Y-family DNA polymerase [Bacteroidota bacterium]|jgi:DNA polymerase V|nr:Y-family DNA polymerase [Bacteroidota bacterium]NLP19159.1 Y-family DNA polymerase [Bacteroidales bacterium]OQC46511.1 MAG: DNA polymerase V subunit UmuC [Bacteroidetes bacterium ADurb.Bin028]HNY43787.1 Y-family DNA polymerase [Bacteroidales bacterium]HOD88040.1 Y-family DNA polymerase [Bacteroidales bacterium]